VFPSAWAADPPLTSAVYSADGGTADVTLAAYRALSASLSRNYDRTQDISPRQLLLLLEVTERIGAGLGQALATGEHESARTWNDHVRPTLKNGSLGSATGVWQFQPATFHGIIKRFGTQLLAASAADAAAGRDRMDLGEGPFTDAQVRGLIQDTVDGKRGADDEELQLLRHNFAVLAFAKHYLSVDNGATTPEEDYLFHFLGEKQGRRILALARGEARDTLCVKPVEPPTPAPETNPAPTIATGLPPAPTLQPTAPPRPVVVAGPTAGFRTLPAEPQLVWSRRELEPRPTLPTQDQIVAMMNAEAALQAGSAITTTSAPIYPVIPEAPPPVSSEWGLPANSGTVTGNLGMFYRDGKGQSQPYTWAQFMDHLAKRVRAESQPALVRAKYGVGFSLKGGDLPERAFKPDQVADAIEFRHEHEQSVLLPETLVTGTLGPDEARHYKQRLAALISQGEDKPTDTLPPEVLAALHHLKVLPTKVQDTSTTHPEVRKALQKFRAKVGKDAPDDPAQVNLLMPAERIALELYGQRIGRYAALQAGQQASSSQAPDLNRIKKMPKKFQRIASPHLAAVQRALAAQGLLTQPTKKSVWRDKKRKKHVDYKKVPFAGKADQTTVTALNTFQMRNGLRRTDGVLDAVTLDMLGLPPLGPDIVLPLSGPQCAVNAAADAPPRSESSNDGQADSCITIACRLNRPPPVAK